MQRRSLPLSLSLLLPLAFSLAGCGGAQDADPEQAGSGETGDADRRTEATPVAEVSRVRGPGGLRTPELPEGAFLGAGAKVPARTPLTVPAGTLVELELDPALGGGVLRADERTRLVLDDGIEVLEGQVVLLPAAKTGPMRARAGGVTVAVEAGEVLVRNTDGRQHVAVVSGRALLRRGAEELTLVPGESVDMPVRVARNDVEPPEPDGSGGTGGAPPSTSGGAVPIAFPGLPLPVPVLSMLPLRETTWSASFDQAAEMAEDVPRGIGSLTAKRPGSSVEGQPLRIVDQRVQVKIAGRVALTEVEQAFHNDASATMEGIYRFPLPADASIAGLELLVGDEWMEAEVVEKRRARRVFRQIVDATIPRDPALLEWEQGNVFELRVFPIPGKGERRVRLRYTQVLPTAGEHLAYRYPMGGGGATGTEIERFRFDIDIARDGLPEALDGVRTPMLEMSREEKGDRLLLHAQAEHYRPAWDLGVDLPSPKGERVESQTHLDRDGRAYFMLALRPEGLEQKSSGPVHYAFVLDRSHGTTPELWTHGRGVLESMIEGMSADDRFTVLACDTACDALEGGLRESGTDAKGEVERFLEAQVIGGATDLGAMAEAAGRALGPEAGDARRVVVYVGDGVATSGAMAPDELIPMVHRSLRGASFEAVAMGARADLTLLAGLTRRAGGDVLRADPRDDPRSLARTLRLRTRVPASTGLTLKLPEGAEAVHPRELPAMRPGQDLVVVGRLRGPVEGEAVLEQDGRVVDRFPLSLHASRDSNSRSQPSAHLPRTWAAKEIEHLTVHAGAEARDEIVRLSTRYGVLSRYTAMLALENDAMYREFGIDRSGGSGDAWSSTGTKENERSKHQIAGGKAPAGSQDKAEEQAMPGEAFVPEAEEDEPRGPVESAEAEKDDFVDELPADDDPIGGADGAAATPSGSSSAGRGASRPRPESKAAKKPSKKKSSASSKPDLADPFDDGDWGGGGGGGWYEPPAKIVRQPQFRITKAGAPSSQALDRVDALMRARDADPDARKHHRSLVRTAIYYGHERALEFAQAWAAADPDHGPALRALADLLAARGDAHALRALASTVEVNAFDAKWHRRLALAHETAGDLARACSHRRAVVSIDPSQGADHAELVRCLHRAGETERARSAVSDGLDRATRDRSSVLAAERELDRAAAPRHERLHGYPDLDVKLTWEGDAELDIVLVDRRGRRLSALHPESVLVRSERGQQTLTLRRLHSSVFVEVTRRHPGGGPVRAHLKVSADGTTRRFEADVDRGTVRLARVSHR